MSLYLGVLKQAFLFFPIIAFVFTIPYILFNYHKYGSLLSIRILVVYSFILYLICVYFLVILPLPSREAVAKMTGPRMQLIPFNFIRDIIKESHFTCQDPKSILSFVINPALFQVLFNILMLVPFGVYLRYYFGFSLKKTVLASFLLSLFFELTQLSGLYFIYPRSYRLFDADDLMANTLGGALGYLALKPFLKFLPSREQIDAASLRRSQEVSLLRRFTALMIDLILAGIWTAIGGILLSPLSLFTSHIDGILFFAYFVLFPVILHGRTPGKKFARLRIVSANGKAATWYQYVIRYGSIVIILYIVPGLLARLATFFAGLTGELSIAVKLVVIGCLAGIYFFYILFELIMAAMHRNLFYETLSKTQVISTTPKEKIA